MLFIGTKQSPKNDMNTKITSSAVGGLRMITFYFIIGIFTLNCFAFFTARSYPAST